MRVVHIGYYYGVNGTGGAAIAATRIHKALLKKDVESIFLCTHNRSGESETVIEIPFAGTVKRKWLLLLAKLLRNIWRLTTLRRPIATNAIPMGMLEAVKSKSPDVVHIHWVSADAISFKEIAKMPCPVVIHLHDMWMINGFNPYPHEDRRYVDGFLADNTCWLERNLVARKQYAVQRAHASFAGPSAWVCGECERSIIGNGHKCFHVPYFVDPTFRFDPRLRKPHDKCIVLFGAHLGRCNPIKGFDDLKAALQLLPCEKQRLIEVAVFGESAEDYKLGEVNVRFMGQAATSEELMSFYHQGDVFAFPSREETQGQTKLEAMLCGLPVIAFDRTACAEGIIDGVTGKVVSDGDIEKFSKALLYYLDEFLAGRIDDETRIRISMKTGSLYDSDKIASQYIKMYEQVVNGR